MYQKRVRLTTLPIVSITKESGEEIIFDSPVTFETNMIQNVFEYGIRADDIDYISFETI